MKKILFSIFFLIATITAFCQYPNIQYLGNGKTKVVTKGAVGADSGIIYIYNFPDTLVANRGFLKGESGIVIRVNDILYRRNNAGTAWITDIPPMVYNGVDSVTSPSTGILCVWTGGVSSCFNVTTPVVPSSSVDSVVITGNQLCYYVGATPTCYTVTSTINNVTNITQFIDSSIAINNYYNGFDSTTRLISGSVIWDSLFVFHNTTLIYKINGVVDTALGSSMTVTGLSGVYDQYFIFYADTNRNVGYILGGTNPTEIPTVDANSQILLATYFVAANDTVPQGLSTEVIYKENVEWTVSGTAKYNPLWTNNVFAGTYALRDSSNSVRSYIDLVDSSGTHSAGDYWALTYQLRLDATFATNQSLQIQFLNNSSVVSSTVTVATGQYGYTRTVSGTYQAISVPLSAWTFTNSTFNKVRFIVANVNANGFNLDNIILQTGGANVGGTIVTSFNNRTNNVYPQRADYTWYFDSVRLNFDSSKYTFYNNGTLKDSITTLRYTLIGDTCFIYTISADTIYTTFNQNCGGSGGGGSGTVENVTASVPLSITGVSTVTPNVVADTTSGTATSLVTQYQRKKTSDSLLSLINTKLNITDTTFLHNKLISSFVKNATRDSIILTLMDGTRYAVKDSVGSGSGGVVSVVAGDNITVDNTDPANPIVSASLNTVTEQKIYYRQEYYANQQINTGTGAISSNVGTAISDYLHVSGSESITISVPDGYSTITIYGWTYDTTLTAISEIRSNALIGTLLRSYTFTTPSNARFLNVYIKYGGVDFSKALKINSTNTITYNTPITPEQFTGSKSVPIQSALDFARFTSTGVTLNGEYSIDSSLLLSSGSTLILNNAIITLDSGCHTNIIRNEAVANKSIIFARGNRDVKIIGIGNAVIQGSKENWGGDNPTGVGSERWRSIGVLLANVQGFYIDGVKFQNTNSWAMCFEQSRLGSFKNIIFSQDSSHPNQDGVNIRRGSNRITVENVRGVVWDDIVALTNIKIAPTINILDSTIYEPYATNMDIHDVIVKDIQRDTSGIFSSVTNPSPFYKTGILLLCEDSLKIHDVTIDGITNVQQVQFGFTFYQYWVSTQAGVNDMYNIGLSNTNLAKINFARPIKNSSFINISDTDRVGQSNAVLFTGSLNIYRKFYNNNVSHGNITTVNTSAINEYKSTTQGVILPNMSTTNRNAISSPAKGLIVYDTTLLELYQYNGTSWNSISGNKWQLNGNSGTTAGTNFIGTTDLVNLVFKRGNVQSGIIDSSSGGSTSFGFSSLLANSIGGGGIGNTAIGYKSLVANTIGPRNTAVGYNAILSNISGANNTAVGYGAYELGGGGNNTAIGYNALRAGGANQTAVGYEALLAGTGGANTALGYQALKVISSGQNSTAFGYQAGLNATGSGNVFIGASSGAGLTGGAGTYNVAIGSLNTLYAITSGGDNVAIARGALAAVTSTSGNTAVGRDALILSTGSNNIALGKLAGAYSLSTSSLLFINSLDRTNLTGDTSSSIIYGVQSTTTGNQRLKLGGGGNVGIGIYPTSRLHIPAGTATAGTGPFKLTTGTNMTVAEAGTMEYTTPQLFFTNGGMQRQELFQGQQSRVSTQFDKTNTTLSDITGLTATLVAGKIYRFEAKLYTTSDVAGGVKFAIAGTATATNIIYEGLTTDAGLTTQSRAAALATAVGAVTAVTAAYTVITGTITVNAAGTLTVQFAENAATVTSSVLVGSTFVVTEML